MHFHIVKMYKDKEVKKNVKFFFLSMCDVKVFLTFTFTEYGTVLTTILPILFLYDPDLVQAFLKKWWVESDFKAPNLPLSLRFKGSGCHYNSI
jgi:hypothetical protein